MRLQMHTTDRAWVETLMMRMIASDFLFRGALHVARDQVIGTVLATLPELLANASAPGQARVNATLHNILPVSARAQGLASDSAVGAADSRRSSATT